MVGRIYSLQDPRTGRTVYVGETVHSIRDRLGGHIANALDDSKADRHTPIVQFIRSMIDECVIPRVILLEEFEQSGVDSKADKRQRWEREQHWVKVLRESGEPLLNKRSGVPSGYVRGPSKLKGVPLPSERKQKHIDRLKERMKTPEGLAHLNRMRELRWKKQ